MIEFNQNNISVEPSLPDYSYCPNFVEIQHIKLHFIDEGEKDRPTILFLHGVPTWSYTFRKIYPVCLNAGYRIIAPDLPGFGKSDKSLNANTYSIKSLVETVAEFIRQQELTNVFLFGHDWGAVIGMLLVAKYSGLFSGIIVCNGYLPDVNTKAPLMFWAWQKFCKYSPILPIGRIVDLECNRKLLPEERKAYDYPFLSNSEKVAVRILPQHVPVKSNSADVAFIEESWDKLEQCEKPFLTLFSTKDRITRGGEKLLQLRIPGTKNQAHKILNGRHYIQEDAPLELGLMITDFVKKNHELRL